MSITKCCTPAHVFTCYTDAHLPAFWSKLTYTQHSNNHLTFRKPTNIFVALHEGLLFTITTIKFTKCYNCLKNVLVWKIIYLRILSYRFYRLFICLIWLYSSNWVPLLSVAHNGSCSYMTHHDAHFLLLNPFAF